TKAFTRPEPLAPTSDPGVLKGIAKLTFNKAGAGGVPAQGEYQQFMIAVMLDAGGLLTTLDPKTFTTIGPRRRRPPTAYTDTVEYRLDQHLRKTKLRVRNPAGQIQKQAKKALTDAAAIRAVAELAVYGWVNASVVAGYAFTVFPSEES